METSSKLFIGLLVCLVILIFVAWILFLDVSLKLHRGYKIGMAKQEQCGEYYLEGESIRANIYEAFIKSEKQLKATIDLIYMILAILMIGLGGLIAMNYKSIKSYKDIYKISEENIINEYNYYKILNIISIVFLLAMTITIFVLFKQSGEQSLNVFDIMTYTTVDNEKVSSIDDAKKRILKNQLPVLLFSAIAVAVACFTLALYSTDFNGVIITTIALSVITIVVFLPTISQNIYDLKAYIGNYYEDITDKLNNKIYQESKKNVDLAQHIRINMRSLDNLEEFPVISNENKNTLYRYITNGSTLSDLKNISIPFELSSEIQPNYLMGENIFVLKSDLLTYYNKPNGQTLKPLKKYFKEGINEKKQKDLLEKYVLKNDTYKLSNSIPSEIRQQLQQLRLNTNMETVVKKYTKKMTTISLALFIIIFYVFFHTVYNLDKTVAPQIMVLVALVLLVVIGFAGWFFKELWL